MKAKISASCGLLLLLLLCAISLNVKAQQEPVPPAPPTSNQTTTTTTGAPPNSTINTPNPATNTAPSVEPEPATIVSVAPEKREEPEIIGGEDTSDNNNSSSNNTLASNTGISSVSNSSAPIQASVMRARSLAALGNFAGAVQILEPLRASAADSATANVARLLLTSIYLEQAEYKKTQTLLGEAFNGRTANEATMRAYYTVAGQLLNGVRARLNHYRAYNVDITVSTLPVEINNDLDGIRNLLDSLIAQASTLQNDEKSNNSDAAALFEDASGVRMNLARTRNERDEWQRRVADARQRLVAADARMQIDAATTISKTIVNNSAAPRRAASSAPAITRHNTSTITTNNDNNAAANALVATNALSKNRKESSSRKEIVAKPEPAPAETATALNSEVAALNTTATTSISSSSPAVTVASAAPNAASPTATAASPTVNASNLTVEVGALVTKATQRVQPVYPPTARAARVAGVVTVYLTLNEQGKVENVRSTTGPELLRRAAEDAARRWRFRQTLVNQQAVRVSGYISFNFAL